MEGERDEMEEKVKVDNKRISASKKPEALVSFSSFTVLQYLTLGIKIYTYTNR